MDINYTSNVTMYYNDVENATTEFPDYELDLSIEFTEVAHLLFMYGLTFLLGVVGNTLVIVTALQQRRNQTVTNIFLTSLATADLLLILICVPLKVSSTFNRLIFFKILAAKF